MAPKKGPLVDIYRLVKYLMKGPSGSSAGCKTKNKKTEEASLNADDLRKLCQQSKKSLGSQSALLRLDGPTHVVGDVHGKHLLKTTCHNER